MITLMIHFMMALESPIGNRFLVLSGSLLFTTIGCIFYIIKKIIFLTL